MEILICVGSSCHLKGSYDIINLFKTAIKNNNLEDVVTIRGTFCLGKCASLGTTIKVDNEIITGVTPENFDSVFNKYVLKK